MVFRLEDKYRDACWFNLTMDSSRLLGPKGYHYPRPTLREDLSPIKVEKLRRKAAASVQYYLIDFGLSYRFPSYEERGLVLGNVGQNKSVPELSKRISYDPFKVDIYQLGSVINRLIQVSFVLLIDLAKVLKELL